MPMVAEAASARGEAGEAQMTVETEAAATMEKEKAGEAWAHEMEGKAEEAMRETETAEAASGPLTADTEAAAKRAKAKAVAA